MATFTLSGTIYDAFDSPLQNAAVSAFDKDLRKEQLLGSATTNAQGAYQIDYRTEALARAERKEGDVFIRVVFDGQTEESAISYNAPDKHIINLKVGGNKPYRGTPEFDALLALIMPLLKGQGSEGGDLAITELKEVEKTKDFTFLANETGEPKERIALLPQAYRLSADTHILPDIYYGLFRLGFPTNLDELLKINSVSLKKGLEEAIEQNIISLKWESQIEKIVALLNSRATQRLLDNSPDNRDLRKLLKSSLPDNLHEDFINAVLANEATPEKVWDGLKSKDGFKDGKAITQLQSLTQVHLFTGQAPALTAKLFKDNPQLKDLRELVQFDKASWQTQIQNVVDSGELKDFPEGIEGSTTAEKAKNYAITLTEQAKQLFPTSFFAARMSNDGRRVGGANQQDVLKFFEQNPDFDLKSNQIDKDFDKTEIKWASITNQEATKTEIKRISRLYKLGDDYTAVSALYNDNIKSATDIVSKYSQATFIANFKNQLGDEATAKKLFQNAQNIHSKANILTLMHRMQNDVPIYAINAGVTTLSPDYETLFGSNSLCDCEHCQSVYSPAAYLVDILNLLRIKSHVAYAELDKRRPDLKHLLLTCQNTNTPLPYIDLVNELLEDKVAGNSNTYQTTLTAAELAAFPEHNNAQAAATIATAKNSFKLPINLPLEETRNYLDKLGIKRYELMELFYAKDKYENIAIATEYLGLSKEEREILMATGAAALPSIPLANVNDFLNTTGLNYKELVQLLECSFINPIDPATNTHRIKIVSTNLAQPATCDLSLLKISGATADVEKKINPFIRLWKKSGWELYDLDKALMAFGATTIDDDLLIKLSHVARIKTDYALSTDEVITLLSAPNKAYSILSQILRLSVEELEIAQELTESDIFDINKTEQTLTFIDKVEKIKNSGFNFKIIEKLLTTKSTNEQERLSKLLLPLKIKTEEFVYLRENETKLGIMGLWTLPVSNQGKDLFPAFEKLLALIQLRNKLKVPAIDWFTIFDEQQSSFLSRFEELTQTQNAQAIFAQLGYSTFPDDYLEGEHLLHVLHCANLSKQIGTNAVQLVTLAQDGVTSAEALLAQSLLKAKYDETSWLEVIKPISNQLRSKKRNALTAYLIGNKSYKDTNTLYADLLIDTEMAACMMTSRLKQAISSVQLFVDRCLLNLETGIQLSEEFATQWKKWRKMYRVWEANRKVFLYPENWIEPDLRDDKSPFFKELESKLRQNEVTDEVAQEALLGYLEKLDTVANLEVVGLFPDETTGQVHVIGRTRNIPHLYYYRKQYRNVWTAWEKMDLDIEGDHILPVVWNGRLMVFWGLFTEKQVEGSGSTKIGGQVGDMTMNSTPPNTYFELKLAWSEYKNGKWGAKKVSNEFCEIRTITIPLKMSLFLMPVRTSGETIGGGTNPPTLPPTTASTPTATTLIFSPQKELCFLESEILNDKNQLCIKIYQNIGVGGSGSYNSFVIDGCHKSPVLSEQNVLFQIYLPPNTKLDSSFQKEVEESSFDIFDSGIFSKQNQTIPIFKNTPGKFQLLSNHHEIEVEKLATFFYENGRNNFYVHSNAGLHHPPIVTPPLLSNILSRASFTPSIDITNTKSLPASVQTFTPTHTSNLLTFTKLYLGKTFSFQTFYHPFVCDFIKTLNTDGIDGLYQEGRQNRANVEIFTSAQYAPTQVVQKPYPVEKVDFDFSGTYSIYNWELFFHIPLLMATRLMQNQKFDEARQWFHYIFDPTKPAQNVADFWITKPFKDLAKAGITPISVLVEQGGEDLSAQLDYIANHPFQPHGLARLRLSAYMRTTVMKYIDNLIAWGDQLFQRDTLESINEATLLYVMAANLLGKKPVGIPARAKTTPQSFEDVKDKLNEFSNAKVEIEGFILPSDALDMATDSMPLMWLFCFPKNDKLLSYWDTVADRLFKLRNCMNIQGVVRQLPLFEPPIDPALLVKAAAAGLDLNTVLNDMSAALPNYRFQVMLQKANELCSDVKGLGNELLSALEKKDAETLSLLRSSHEIKILELMRDIKVSQRDEAKENLDSLLKNKKVVEERVSFYSKNIATNLNSSERLYFSSTQTAIALQEIMEVKNYLASAAALAPDVKIGSGFTIGATFGGGNLSKFEAFAGNALQSISTFNRLQAESANMKGVFERRLDDWKFQAKTADLELKQMDKQIVAAEIRLVIAEKDLENHDVQIENAKEVDDYMWSKFTNAELYDYMVKELSSVYFQSYQLAYQTAKKAEKCYQHELGVEPSTSFIQFGYWDSLKQGLLSGEKLQYDLRRLENAYMEQNTREFEITKHISLKQLDPFQLLKLRENGSCEINLPEELFDLDFPGHYFRRIKSVSITIPCILGPYTSVNATLRLESSSTRISTKISEGYPKKKDSEDDRFVNNSTITTAIATSNAQNDSGVFQLNFQDERFLPFERAGAISTWKLELMEEKSLRQFDYNTISDVVVHLNYTAREDAALKSAAITYLKTLTDNLGGITFQRLFSIKHDFPNEWHQWQRQNQPLQLTLKKYHFPYFAQLGELGVIGNGKLYSKKDNNIDLQGNKMMTVAQVQQESRWSLTEASGSLDALVEDWYLVVDYQIHQS